MNGHDPRTTRPLGSGGPTGTQMMPDGGLPGAMQGPGMPMHGMPQQGGPVGPGPNMHGMPGAPGMGGMPGPHGTPGPHGMQQAMPAAPGDRRGELQQGNKTVYEFTGAAAAKELGSKPTFMGATLDLTHHKEERHSNLRSGASTWIFIAVAVVATIGVSAAFIVGRDGEAAHGKGADASVAEPAAEEPAAEAPAEDAKAEEPPAEEAKADDAKADDAKADAPAEDPSVKPAEEPKAEPKPASTPKKTTTKKKTTTSSSGSTTPKPSTGGSTTGKTLSPKKPPRDPLKGLPKPP